MNTSRPDRSRLPCLRVIRRPDLKLALATWRKVDLLFWFFLVDLYKSPAALNAGGDASLYAAAARAWLAGIDPWIVSQAGIRFAAPPPTLLLFTPFAFVDPVVTRAFWVCASAVAVVLVIRRLKLAWWWALFPPLWEGVLVGNPDPVVLAALVAASPVVAGLAPILKIYGLVPLAGEHRWRPIAVTMIMLTTTAWVLPWREFLADLPYVSASLTGQAAGLSAISVPWLIPIGLIGLAGLGLRRAGWLAVPVLWPSTQLHYAAIAVPAMTPLLAFGLSMPIPGAPAVAVALQAVIEFWTRRAHARVAQRMAVNSPVSTGASVP